ncbi:MAG TPA: Gfo/Idh/MocA family oxidoreductase [Opitutaceae bacterium]|jgi:UDP-N-acetyl-2-amino-2-deoxyglucuronate dehydrogenase|nr:Gfo/Idh/MocA family oxidoreductase [Opitutaceae bacterium]
MIVSPTVGFGIIGVGMIAGYHAQAIREARGAALVGIAGRSEEKVRAFAEKHHIPFSTTRIEELVARPDIQVICVATPSGAHLEAARAAIRAGKHVVIEKPLEITVERADEILRAADAAGVRVAPIFQARFGEGARTVKAALDAGRFGRLVLCSAYVKWQRTAAYYQGWKGTLALDGGGVLINQAIHAIDLLQWFAGLPAEVFAWKTLRVHTGIEGEDTACAALRFAHGGLGVIEASTALYPGWQRRIEICGEHGSVALEDDVITRWDFRMPLLGDDAVRAAKTDDRMRSGAGAPDSISHHGHLRQIQDLIDALHSGRPLAIDGHEARKTVVFIRALYASAERGEPVKLDAIGPPSGCASPSS